MSYPDELPKSQHTAILGWCVARISRAVWGTAWSSRVARYPYLDGGGS